MVKACDTVSKPQRIILASDSIGMRMPAKLRNFANYNRSKHCKLNLKNGAATSIRNQIPTGSGGNIGSETPILILILGLGLRVILTIDSSVIKRKDSGTLFFRYIHWCWKRIRR